MNASVKNLFMMLFVFLCTSKMGLSALLENDLDYYDGLANAKSKQPTLWRIRAINSEDEYADNTSNKDISYEDELSMYKKRNNNVGNIDTTGILWPPIVPISNAMMLSDERKRSIEKALSMNMNEKQMRENLAKFFSPAMLKKMLQVVHAKGPIAGASAKQQIVHDTSMTANTVDTPNESEETQQQQNQSKSYGNLLHMFHRFG
jgi:hypothetical protein